MGRLVLKPGILTVESCPNLQSLHFNTSGYTFPITDILPLELAKFVLASNVHKFLKNFAKDGLPSLRGISGRISREALDLMVTSRSGLERLIFWGPGVGYLGGYIQSSRIKGFR